MAGQSVMDRVIAARHSIAGQGLAKSVCKATTEEIIGPKKKHLDYLLQCTNEPNVSIPQMADLLIERTQHANWVVVYKSLISINNLMNYGNERFTQYLASNNCSFNLSGFVDKGGVQGYDMSTYIRRYAKYLNEKAVSYRSMAFDFCKVKRGKDDGLLRTMNTEKLLKTLPVLQQQLDALLEFDCTPNELTNGVITACFLLLFKDLIRLFACYNDGIINLLEKYFDMNKKQCKDALDMYKKFLVRMDKVSEFLKVAENMGIDKGDIPDLAKAPASLLDALEQHLGSLEGKKVGTATTPTGSAKPASFTTALNSMSTNAFDVSEAEKKRILDEENLQLQKLKAGEEAQPAVGEALADDSENIFDQKVKDGSSPQKVSAASNNPFATTSPAATPNAAAQPNLFGSPTDNSASSKPSDDLMALGGNAFMGNVQTAMTSAYAPQAQAASSTNPFGTASFQTNGYAPNPSGFTSEADFAKAFSNGSTNSQATFGMAPIMTPASTATAGPPGLDLGAHLDPLDGAGDLPLPPAPAQGMPSDFGMGLDISPTPPLPQTAACGGPFAELEGLDQPAVSPSPSPIAGFGLGGPSPVLSEAPGQFGIPHLQQGSTTASLLGQQVFGVQPVTGLGGPPPQPPPYYGQTSAMAVPMAGGNKPVGAIGTMGVMGGPPGMGGVGIGGSPSRIMTRGGKSPIPSLSSSPSGPGLEDAVKALGLAMSPSKGSGKGKGATGGSRPISPGQAMMGQAEPSHVLASSFEPLAQGMFMGGAEGQGNWTDPGLTEGMQGQEAGQVGQGFDAFGDVLMPHNKSLPQAQPAQQSKPVGGDLDSSLASLASNLNVSGGAGQMKKDHQWQPKGENKLTGGTSFQRQPIAQSTTAAAATWGQPGFQQPPNMMGAPGAPMMYGQPMAAPMGQPQPMMGMAQPMAMGMQQPGMAPMAMQQPAAMYGMQRMPMGGGAFAPQATQPAQGAPPSNVNDPFGAL